jgi:hypothetical protein
MFLKYVLSQGWGELATGNDSRNEPQSNALLRTTPRYLLGNKVGAAVAKPRKHQGQVQLRMTLADWPVFITSKPFWNSS